MAWIQISTKMRIGHDESTGEYGVQMKLENQSGSNSVKGTVVAPSGSDAESWDVITADDVNAIGVVYEGGVADGSECWVWMNGSVCQVLLEDGTASTVGYWAKVSDNDAGRADASNAAPPGGTIGALEDHMSEIGHCMETKGSGTDVLAKIMLHFN
jgi:hypothetical protein